MESLFKIDVEKISGYPQAIYRACLDFPKPAHDINLLVINEEGLWVQGWVLKKHSDQKVSVYIQQDKELIQVELSKKRPDVIEIVLNEASEHHRQLQCGFRLKIKATTDLITIGFRIDDVLHPWYKITISGALKVLKGKDKWLFLDNDTNGSVQQFRGEVLISPSEYKRWIDYLEKLNLLKQKHSLACAILIAPSKEFVYPQYYPFEKGQTTVQDQLLELGKAEKCFVYPEHVLRTHEQRTYRITDTHWNDHGARTALLSVCDALDIDRAAVEELFARDRYILKNQSGDLGRKIFPPTKGEELCLSNRRYANKRVYDNGMANFGRVLITCNEKALMNKTCMVFGSSSTYTMMNYIYRIFTRVVVIHSAGNIDQDLVQLIKPDYLIAQTNGRFCIRAPEFGFSLVQVIKNKLDAVGAEEVMALINSSAAQTTPAYCEYAGIFHNLLLQARDQSSMR